MGFREVLDFAGDFKLMPGRLYRRDLERIYAAVVSEKGDTEAMFSSKLNYQEFVELFAITADYCESMDRDGWQEVERSKLTRVKKVAHFVSLQHFKELKVFLHNVYRDVHFWKLRPDEDFKRVAQMLKVKAMPTRKVHPIEKKWHLDPMEDAEVLRYLKGFTWLQDAVTGQWEAFETPLLDMGTNYLGAPPKRFKMRLLNRRFHLMRFEIEPEGLGPLRIPLASDQTLTPGETLEVPAEPIPA